MLSFSIQRKGDEQEAMAQRSEGAHSVRVIRAPGKAVQSLVSSVALGKYNDILSPHA